jgi:hypothetical protein
MINNIKWQVLTFFVVFEVLVAMALHQAVLSWSLQNGKGPEFVQFYASLLIFGYLLYTGLAIKKAIELRRLLEQDGCIEAAVSPKGNLIIRKLAALHNRIAMMLMYSFFYPRQGIELKQPDESFAYHEQSGSKDMFWLSVTMQVPTLPFFHFFLAEQEPMAAWFLTVMTVVSVIWYWAEINACKHHPILVADDAIHYRFGLAWKGRIALDNIKSVRLKTDKDKVDAFNAYMAPLCSTKNVLIELEKPVTLKGYWGNFKRKKLLTFPVSDAGKFIHRLSDQSAS